MFSQAVPDDAGVDLAAMTRASQTIRVDTLDEVLWPEHLRHLNPPPHIAVLKMDVQGFESFVMGGAKALLKARAIRTIKTEVAAAWLKAHGSSPAELCGIIIDAGFVIDGVSKASECADGGSYDIIARLS